MVTVTAAISDAPAAERRMPLPIPRWLATAVLIGGSTLQLVEEVLEPPFATDADRFAWLATHSTWHAVDLAIGLAAVPLLIASVLILARLSWRMPRLARVGASCCVVGFSGLAAAHGFEAAEVALLDAGVSPAVLLKATAHLQPALAVPLLAMFLGALTVGLPMLLLALWGSRSVPRGAILLSFAFMIVDFAGPEMVVPTHAISFVAFTWMAVSLLRHGRSAAADGDGSAKRPY